MTVIGQPANPETDVAAYGISVKPGDARYPELVHGYDLRWVGTPGEVRLVTAPEQVEPIVREAVRAGKRVSVRSGGHCYADFVYNSEVDLVIDVSTMNRVHWDDRRGAFCVEAGAQLGPIYERLYRDHGVTLPGGLCATVGIGGHTHGGGFGMLTRQFGLVVDHLEAVEMVVVGEGGEVRTVIATRDPADPHHDLWWAVTGGGGGTFGVATRFWFRSPDAAGSAPESALPRPPHTVLLSVTRYDWDQVDEATFARLFTNYCDWHESHSAPGSPGTRLCSILFGRTQGGLAIVTQVDATFAGAAELVGGYHAALTEGTGLTVSPMLVPMQWLASTKAILLGTILEDPLYRSHLKTAWVRKSLSGAQWSHIYRSLRDPEFRNDAGIFQLISVGGQMSAVDPAATATAHRDASMFAEFETFWRMPDDDEHNLAWLRELYHGTFAESGGYPVSGETVDGTYINNPDPDITDPAYNRTGVPWYTLYFAANYPRLQQVKARWDPTDFFRHRQSVRLPG
jgi:hypothetical protein